MTLASAAILFDKVAQAQTPLRWNQVLGCGTWGALRCRVPSRAWSQKGIQICGRLATQSGLGMVCADFGLAVFYNPEALPRTDLGLEGTPWCAVPAIMAL